MENNYLVAFHAMERMFDQVGGMITKFNRKDYKEAFAVFFEQNEEAFDALNRGYFSAIDKDTYMENMANALMGAANAYLSGFTKKKQIENEKINLNLMMVVYIFPALMKVNSPAAHLLLDLLMQKWKEQFPESNISPADYEDIEAGFHRKFCYITTAVCRNSGKPDDCYELTLLRDYRDGYLTSQEQGDAMIREYYDVAPTIVKHINEKSDKDRIYQQIYEGYIAPCIRMIEDGNLSECQDLYTKMVKDLQEEYFYTYKN